MINSRPAITYGAVLRIALPVSLVSLSTPLVSAVDTAVVGQLGDAALIGGVASANVFFNLIFLTVGFLRFSTTGLTAQAAGAGDAEEVLAVVIRAYVLAAVLGAAVIAANALLGEAALRVIAVDDRVRAAAIAYTEVRIWSAPIVFANFALLGWLIGTSRIGRTVALQLFLNIVNIVASIWLVVYAGAGVRGAAAAALIAEAATFAVGCLFLLEPFRGRFEGAVAKAFNRARMVRMVAINADILVRSIVLFLAIALFTRQGAEFGTVILAANAVLLNFFYFTGAAMSGFATAAQQLVGMTVGSGDRQGFSRVLRLTLLGGTACAIGLSLVYAVAGRFLISTMTSDQAVVTVANDYFWWAVAVPVVGMLAFIDDGVFIGATWSRDARNMMLLSGALFLAAWWTLTPAFENHGLWAAFLFFLLLRGLSLHIRIKPLTSQTFRAAAEGS